MADVHGNTTNHSQDGLIICFLNGGMYFQLYHCKRVVCKIWSCAFFNYPFIFALIYWPLLLPSPCSFLLPCRNYNIMPSYFLVYLLVSSCCLLIFSVAVSCLSSPSGFSFLFGLSWFSYHSPTPSRADPWEAEEVLYSLLPAIFRCCVVWYLSALMQAEIVD